MSSDTATVDDGQLAARHRSMWASGDYPRLAAELVAPLGPVLVEAAGIGAGDRVLDVAAGTGNAAIPAARRGAVVTASDLTPNCWSAAVPTPSGSASHSNGGRPMRTRSRSGATNSTSSCRVSG